jgi:hypothetical protein
MTTPSEREPVRSLLAILRGRRSRRFGLGMAMSAGPLAYQSQAKGLRLSEEEEALLAFAACGVTGPALADLAYGPGQGGTMLGGLLGRTIPSADALHAAALLVLNEEATYYLKRPQDFAPGEAAELVRLAGQGAYVDLYRRSRVKIRDGRATPPTAPPFNMNINRWSIYDPAATYFLPVSELTFLYINALLEAFDETTGFFLLDERAGFRPAGLRRFARSRGGHLRDDPRQNFVGTVQLFESVVSEYANAEQAMMIQNLSLMTQAMGLGGFPHWAHHPFAWFQALDFRMAVMPASRFLAVGWPQRWGMRLLRLDQDVPYAVGLERDGVVLLKPFCPPNYPCMEAAVRAVVDLKFGAGGVYRARTADSAWVDPSAVAAASPGPSEATVAATVAYCEYLYQRYGRFPAYPTPLGTALGFQANHLDLDFYQRHYRPEALTDTQRNHMRDWHGG